MGAAVWIGVAGRRTTPSRQIDAVIGELEMTVRESAAGALARAVTLSQLPRVGWAVATDEATVRDLTTEELAFRPQPGEHIEIAQVERSQRRVRRLIRIPADTRPTFTLSEPGLQLVPDGDRTHVMAVVKVEPRDQEKVLNGLIAVAQLLDVANVGARFGALGVGARLETPTGSIVVSVVRATGGTREVRRPLRGSAADGTQLVMMVPGGTAWGHVAGGMGLLVAAVMVSMLLIRRADAAAGQAETPLDEATPSGRFDPGLQTGRVASRVVGAATPVRTSPVAPPAQSAPPEFHTNGSEEGPTADIQGYGEDMEEPTVVGATPGDLADLPGNVDASGTLAPIPGVRLPGPGGYSPTVPPAPPGGAAPPPRFGVTPLPPPGHGAMPGVEPGKPRSLEVTGPVSIRNASTTVPSSLFVTGAGGAADRTHAPALQAADNPWTAEYRKLFTEFVKLRRTCGESTEDLNRDRFVEALQQKRIELVERHGATDVRFRLAFDNGKAAVRFKTVT